MTGSQGSPPRDADLPAGFDDEDPYEDTDIGELPDWWQDNIEHFRTYGMRPYRPPRFSDGTITKEVIDDLETDLDVDIEFRAVNPEPGSDWEIVVDGEVVEIIGRERTGEGYTQYHRTASEVRSLIRSATRAEDG